MNFGRVGILYGGRSAEREVSLMSGQGVYEALLAKGVEAYLFDTGKRSLTELAQENFDCVFIALHGRYGEDGTIQGALELLGIPYTGSGHMASALAMDKVRTKQIWRDLGLPTPEYRVVQADRIPENLVPSLGLPMIIKPPHEGSTLGLTKVTTAGQIPAAVKLACQHDSTALAESFIAGRELTVPILGTGGQARALPVIEIIAPDGNYDYEHKYISNQTKYECPANLEPDLAAAIQQLSVQAYQALNCSGWARADVMLDAENKPWLLEMNTAPGMTSHSLVPMGAKAIGISYADLCLQILSTASCKLATKCANQEL